LTSCQPVRFSRRTQLHGVRKEGSKGGRKDGRKEGRKEGREGGREGGSLYYCVLNCDVPNPSDRW
jgi:hypothetical protein